MTTYNITGAIVSITPTHAVGKTGMDIREIVVDTADPSSPYRNPVALTAKKDKCTLLEGYKVGDRVSVRFTIDGRKWEPADGPARYYTTLTVWGVNLIGVAAPQTAPAQAEPPAEEALPF